MPDAAQKSSFYNALCFLGLQMPTRRAVSLQHDCQTPQRGVCQLSDEDPTSLFSFLFLSTRSLTHSSFIVASSLTVIRQLVSTRRNCSYRVAAGEGQVVVAQD